MIPTNPSGHLTSWPAIKNEYPRAQASMAVVSTAYRTATGGHKVYKTDAPQSIVGLRDQFDWAPDGSAYDLGDDVWHFKNQQLVIADKVVKIRGGVFVIEPGKDGRCGLLVRGRKTPLTFEGTTFIVIGEPSVNQEAAVYAYECDQPVAFRGCVFAGAPKVATAYARQPLGAYEPLSVGRAISAKSSGTVAGAGVVIDECSFLCKDERQVATGQGTPAIDISGTIKGNARQWFIDHKEFVGVLQYYAGGVVRHCEIRGGYYGISADACDGIVIEGNTIAGQMRCVSMQNGTKNAVVRQNALLEMASTAVHMAYGTHSSLVELNTASSTVIHGQAMIQAYCGCHDITVRNNTVATVGAAQGPWFYLYGGNGVALGRRGHGVRREHDSAGMPHPGPALPARVRHRAAHAAPASARRAPSRGGRVRGRERGHARRHLSSHLPGLYGLHLLHILSEDGAGEGDDRPDGLQGRQGRRGPRPRARGCGWGRRRRRRRCLPPRLTPGPRAGGHDPPHSPVRPSDSARESSRLAGATAARPQRRRTASAARSGAPRRGSSSSRS